MPFCCSALQHTATHCNALQHTAAHCSSLQHTVAHCSTLQLTAAHCNTLQPAAIHYLMSPDTCWLFPAVQGSFYCLSAKREREALSPVFLAADDNSFHRLSTMGWLQSVGSIRLQVSFAEYRLFYRALLQKRPII